MCAREKMSCESALCRIWRVRRGGTAQANSYLKGVHNTPTQQRRSGFSFQLQTGAAKPVQTTQVDH